MSLKARLSLLSVALLLGLLLLGGIASYVALGAYQRINEAQALDRRYDVTLREFRFAANNLLRPSVPGCAVSRAGLPRVLAGGKLSAPYASQCVAPAFAGPQVTALVVATDGGLLGCAGGTTESFRCEVGSSDYPTLPAGDYLAAARGAQRRYYLVGTGPGERLVVVHRFPATGHAVALVQLSESTATLQKTQQSLLEVLGVAGAVLLLLAVLLTPLLVDRALRPLRRVTEASAALASGQLDRRVDEPRGGDEVGRLARAFNDMATAVQRALHVREESEAGMRTFVSDASHELRTPLTTLQGQLDILGRGAAADPVTLQASLGSMRREVTRMSALVEDLLTLTRLESPGTREVREAVDLDALVAETVDELSVRHPGQQVEVDSATPGEAVVAGDREQLRRVVINLATNAAKYAPGGTHRWRTAREEGVVTLSLADQGPGIPDAIQARVFDRFYRGVAESGRATGSGLGLAIVRSVVEAHGGTVTLQSSSSGTTFTVALPAAPPRP
ncbi:MAG: HAMP domain-containing sensor histidine kinase [Candidatus Dormibacteria bacterium]